MWETFDQALGFLPALVVNSISGPHMTTTDLQTETIDQMWYPQILLNIQIIIGRQIDIDHRRWQAAGEAGQHRTPPAGSGRAVEPQVRYQSTVYDC